jgi:hypothetical protein
MGSDNLKADISVADGEVSYTAPVSWACVCRGPWDPCLLLISWVVINYTHRGFGSELLPATAPLNAPFWGRMVCFLSGLLVEQDSEPSKKQKHEQN